jgi:hypothetical protein
MLWARWLSKSRRETPLTSQCRSQGTFDPKQPETSRKSDSRSNVCVLTTRGGVSAKHFISYAADAFNQVAIIQSRGAAEGDLNLFAGWIQGCMATSKVAGLPAHLCQRWGDDEAGAEKASGEAVTSQTQLSLLLYLYHVPRRAQPVSRRSRACLS